VGNHVCIIGRDAKPELIEMAWKSARADDAMQFILRESPVCRSVSLDEAAS
jgi:hypothetical protein